MTLTCLYCGNEVPDDMVNSAGYHCYPADTSGWANQPDVQPLPDAAGDKSQVIDVWGNCHPDMLNS